jgi:Ribbon-helix-helix protein, copG family
VAALLFWALHAAKGTTVERRTKIPMERTSVQLPRDVLELTYLAAQRLGLSQSEFLRQSVREAALRILGGPPAGERALR